MFVIISLTIFVVLLLQYVRRRYSYWQRLGVACEPAAIPFGILDAVVKRKQSFGVALRQVYEKHSAKVVGIYMVGTPTLLVRDAELAQQLMTKDFASFHDRGVYVDEQHDPLSSNLFNLQGAAWRNLRNKLTPSFSSGKIKGMFGTIDDVGDKLVQHLLQQLELAPQAEIDIKEKLTTYAVDIIGSVIFGLEVDSFSQPHNEFRAISEQLLNEPGWLLKLHNISTFICPALAKLLNRLGYKNPVLTQLQDMMQRTIDFRERHNVVRKDLLQLLIRLRQTGKIGEEDDEMWDIETAQESLKEMSIEKITAQAFLFYIAGSETTASAAAFTLYELAMYPELLQEAQAEVDAMLKRHQLHPQDKLNYEAVQELKFLDQCIMETIRKYPGLPFLNRECTADFELPDGSLTIKQGTPILISLFGIQRDESYFPNAEGYDPHRFDADKQNYNQTAYMPFGEGPRHCIALRMGKVSTKAVLAKVLANFDLLQLPHKELTFGFDPAPVLIPVGGLKLRLKKR
ncbi:Cyp6d2 [Drosophila busckii]|uniref:Cyp6d2 n=1 Tax=Drosophila busckii TaxID=30019 RepID=A0A0M4EX47_DROBS|nr:probable cytochrome P450 6d2 [Drosophila busckii]ALC42507.1 Cyp6d2 [Drosophila busckii]